MKLGVMVTILYLGIQAAFIDIGRAVPQALAQS
jgi:hypothetical protein